MIQETLDFWREVQTKPEMIASIHLVGFILATTELLKRLWRRLSASFRYSDVWFISTGSGLLGAWLLWPEDSLKPWWVMGLIISMIVSYAHRWALIGIRWKFPDLAALITGERRQREADPAADLERRAKK